MQNSPNDWPAARIVHLAGGCRAINGYGHEVDLQPIASNGKYFRFNLQSYKTIYSSLDKMNLPVIGVDFYSHAGEIKGEVPPDWRVFHSHLASPWSCANVAMRWSHIGHAAYKRKDGKLWDLASLISHQTRVSSWRLRQISEAYHEQLMARINGGKLSEGQMFEDGFTWLAYLSIQSFLVDACVLRDYLAEFAAHYIYGPQTGSKKVNVTSMSGLIKQFLDKVSNPCDPISVCLKAATTDDGWLKELGSFRDLVVHAAPLAKARQRLFATTVTLKIGQASALLAIRCPIPDNPQTIKDGRATGDHFKDFTDQFNNFAGAAKGDVPNRDGLNYAHQILGKLTELSELLSNYSPVPPEMMVFDKSNIVGEIKIIQG